MEKSPVIHKTVIELPLERFEKLEQGQEEIRNAMKEFKRVDPDEYLSLEEFCNQIKVSRWMFYKMRDTTNLKFVKRLNKVYIPNTEVARYFNGDIQPIKNAS